MIFFLSSGISSVLLSVSFFFGFVFLQLLVVLLFSPVESLSAPVPVEVNLCAIPVLFKDVFVNVLMAIDN